MIIILIKLFIINCPLIFGCTSDIDGGIDWRDLIGPYVFHINGLRYGNKSVTFTLKTPPPTNWLYYDNATNVFNVEGMDLPAQEQSSERAARNAKWTMTSVLRDSIRESKATSYGENITVSYNPKILKGCSRFIMTDSVKVNKTIATKYIDYFVTAVGSQTSQSVCDDGDAAKVYFVPKSAGNFLTEDPNPTVELTMLVTRVDWNVTTVKKIVNGMLTKLRKLKIIPDSSSTDILTTKVV
uniref:Lipoprotein n=1 Tax=Strongyloides stercoralis TaxID=6248 RepID=A0A0K0EIT1_STRER